MAQNDLFEYLALRCRALNRKPVRRSGSDYVLCWLQQTLRGDSNPVLDAAILAGRELRKPVLVYHGIGEHYPYASDRLHSFILQASRSLESDVGRRGLRFLRYVQRESKPRPGLVYELAARASSVIVDDVAAFVSRSQAERVASRVPVAVLAVDGLRLVPESAFSTRLSTTREFRAQAGHSREFWLAEPSNATVSRAEFGGELPLEHDQLPSDDAIGAMLQQCQIDHTLPAVDWCSGDRRHALRHLEWAVERVLPQYAAVRNNAAETTSVSRLSPYLHFGVLSPAEITRSVLEADIGSRHRWKFLDELLTWREYFHHTMARSESPGSYSNIPAAGQRTLEEHHNDPREASYTLAQLVRGETEDETWNAAQRQFVREGWMHNNLRMYWGKKIIALTPAPKKAWATACYLNDRFSLDGRDPATYGNLAWCFSAKRGKPRPVYGTVPMKSDAAMRRRAGMSAWLSQHAAVDIPPSLYVPDELPGRYLP